MRIRWTLAIVGLALAIAPGAADAQPAEKLHRIGMLGRAGAATIEADPKLRLAQVIPSATWWMDLGERERRGETP